MYLFAIINRLDPRISPLNHSRVYDQNHSRHPDCRSQKGHPPIVEFKRGYAGQRNNGQQVREHKNGAGSTEYLALVKQESIVNVDGRSQDDKCGYKRNDEPNDFIEIDCHVNSTIESETI